MKKQLRYLYENAFEDGEKYIDYFFASKYDEENVVALVADNHIVSAMHLIRKKLKIRGKEFIVPFVVAASTLSQFRGKRLFEKVMTSGFDKLKANQNFATALYPFNHTYYLKYGFINATVCGRNVVINVDDLAKVVPTSIKLLTEIYNKFALKCNCIVVRDEVEMTRQVAEWQSDEMLVEIFNFDDKYCYAVSKDGQLDEVCGDVEVLSHCSKFNGSQYNHIGREFPYLQARVVDVELALNSIEFDNDGSIDFSVNDAYYPSNNQCYRLEVINGIGRCDKISTSQNVIDITQLTMAVFGAIGDYGILSTVLKEKENNFCYDKF